MYAITALLRGHLGENMSSKIAHLSFRMSNASVLSISVPL
jgi:hypothetical protein